MKMVLYNN